MDDRRNPSGQRFVILRHEMPSTTERGSHWDLMLENRGILLTWELPQLPPSPLPATFEQLGIHRLPDHRIDYLEYEGPISKGRGSVQRVDFGEFRLTEDPQDGWVAVMGVGRRSQFELLVAKRIFQDSDESTHSAILNSQSFQILNFVVSDQV